MKIHWLSSHIEFSQQLGISFGEEMENLKGKPGKGKSLEAGKLKSQEGMHVKLIQFNLIG